MSQQIKRNNFQHFLERVEDRLAPLPRANRLAFAAACCERAYPNYEFFSRVAKWGDPSILREALDIVWEAAKEPKSPELLMSLEQKCLSVTPDLDDFATEELDVIAAAAQDAAFMIALLLQLARESDARYARRIATFARDTLDTYVQAREKIAANDPDLEQRISEHPLIARELRAEERDLQEVERMCASPLEIQRFRNEAICQPPSTSAV